MEIAMPVVVVWLCTTVVFLGVIAHWALFHRVISSIFCFEVLLCSGDGGKQSEARSPDSGQTSVTEKRTFKP